MFAAITAASAATRSRSRSSASAFRRDLHHQCACSPSIEPCQHLAGINPVALAHRQFDEPAVHLAGDRDQVGHHPGVGLVHVKHRGAGPLHRPGGHGAEKGKEQEDADNTEQPAAPRRLDGAFGHDAPSLSA